MSLGETTDFWSRRKLAVRAEAEAEQAKKARRAEAEATASAEAKQAGKSDSEILEDLGLPAPETLTAGDDFTAFLGKAVPEHLRRRALRQLWGSNPVLANLDGLVDYDEDFTLGSVATGALKTVYQVGRGAVARLDAIAADAPEVAPMPEDTAKGAAAPEPDYPALTEGRAMLDEAGADALNLGQNIPDDQGHEDQSDAGLQSPRPRHMQFTFTDEAAI